MLISRSLASTATATLVHAFVTSRLDYCSTLYIGLPAARLGCIERVIRTAARLIGGIPRTGHVSAYMLDVLHWHQRTQFTPIIRTGVTLCSFCSYNHNPGPCILGGWSLCVEWASVVAKIASQDSF